MSSDQSTRANVLARLHGPLDIRMETESPHPDPGPGEVTLQVVATGTCGSDLHYYLHGANGNFKLQHPMCLGHESAGIVVAVGPPSSSRSPGSNEETWKVGDRVAIEAGVPCRNAAKDCKRCAEGTYNLCPRMRFASSAKTHPHIDGTLRKYMNWPTWLLHRIPDNVSLLSASLVEPLSVVLQGFQRARFCEEKSTSTQASALSKPAPLYAELSTPLPKGESILIIGAGAVGLLACVAAKAKGASFVGAVDIDQGRLDFAKKMGWADEIYKLPLSPPPPKTNGSAEPADYATKRKADDEASVSKAQTQASDVLAHFTKSFPLAADGFDAIFECTGVPSCVQLSIFATRPGGRVVLIGMGHPVQSAFPIGAAALREVDILGVFRYANVYPLALSLLSEGKIVQGVDGGSAKGGNALGGIENLISHRYSLEQTKEAFETLRKGKSEDGKGVIKVFIVDEEVLQKDESK